MDKDNNGEIDANELVSALSNGTWMPFNLQTVKLMISKYHSNQTNKSNANKALGFNEN